MTHLPAESYFTLWSVRVIIMGMLAACIAGLAHLVLLLHSLSAVETQRLDALAERVDRLSQTLTASKALSETRYAELKAKEE